MPRRAPKPLSIYWLALAAAGFALIAVHGSSHAGEPSEASFLAENSRAMDPMMAGMAIKPTGDADQDFVSMMEPHHQAAVAMAQAELRYGHNEQLRRIAQEIIVDQQQEIAAMRLAIGRPLPPPDPLADQPAPATADGAMGRDPGHVAMGEGQ